MRILLALLLAGYASAALAQYKCTSATGAITFQQTPCFGSKTEEKLDVVPNGHPVAASSASAPPAAKRGAGPGAADADNVDKRMLANYDRQRERDALVKAVDSAREDKGRLDAQRQDAIAAARRQNGDDPVNAKALRDALDSINKRYDALAELSDSRQRDAQRALDKWDQAQARRK